MHRRRLSSDADDLTSNPSQEGEQVRLEMGSLEALQNKMRAEELVEIHKVQRSLTDRFDAMLPPHLRRELGIPRSLDSAQRSRNVVPSSQASLSTPRLRLQSSQSVRSVAQKGNSDVPLTASGSSLVSPERLKAKLEVAQTLRSQSRALVALYPKTPSFLVDAPLALVPISSAGSSFKPGTNESKPDSNMTRTNAEAEWNRVETSLLETSKTCFASTVNWGFQVFNEANQIVAADEESALMSKVTGCPHRVVTLAACQVLEQIMETVPQYHSLWSTIRSSIFDSIFFNRSNTKDPAMNSPSPSSAAPNSPSSASTSPQHSPPPKSADLGGTKTRSGAPASTSPNFTKDFRNRYLHAERVTERMLELSREVGRLRDLLSEKAETVDKFNTLSDLTASNHSRSLVSITFRAWRGHVKRVRYNRRSVENFSDTLRSSALVSSHFLRWRRCIAALKAKKQVLLLENQRRADGDTIRECKKQFADLQQKFDIATTSLQLELKQQKELMKNVIEGQAVMNEEHLQARRELEVSIDAAKAESRWWMQVAKSHRNFDDIKPPHPELLYNGECLNSIEERILGGEVKALGKARHALSTFLCSWVNIELSLAGYSYKAVKDPTQDLLEGNHYIALSRILRPGGFDESKRRFKGQLDVFSALVGIIRLQTAQGLFPPLILHCPYYNDFFNPRDFYECQHPTAHLWVLATLFVARAMRQAFQKTHSSLTPGFEGPIPTEAILMCGRNYKKVMAQFEKNISPEQKAAMNSAAKKRRTTRVKSVKPGNLASSSQSLFSSSNASLAKSPRSGSNFTGSISPSRSTAGGDSTVPSPPKGPRKSLFAMERSGSLLGQDASEELDGHNSAENLAKVALDRSGIYKSLPEPDVPLELERLDLGEFLALLESANDSREKWFGLARCVTALILRYRCLDSDRVSAAVSGADEESIDEEEDLNDEADDPEEAPGFTTLPTVY